MKLYIKHVFISSLLLSIFVNASATNDQIAIADSLVNLKKYNSAFKLLDEQPNSNLNPEIVIRKTDIALNYFVFSLMHQIFSFKDLELDESIYDYRGKAGTYDNYLFQIDSILISLIELYPENGKLYKYLGDYYYDVNYIYGENWLVDYNELLKRINDNYLKAKELNVFNDSTLHNIGVVFLTLGKLDGSIYYFSESLKFNENYASSHYNLAYAYYKKRNFQQALNHSLKAFENYEEPELKGDAARLVGLSYESFDSLDNALKYYLIADDIYPNDYYNLTNLLYIYIKKEDIETSNKIALKFFNIAPENPSVIQDIIQYYLEFNYIDDLANLFEQFEIKYKGDDEVLGNIYFHKGLFYRYYKDTKKSLELYNLAREHFKKVYDDDHYVFGIIDEQIKIIEQENKAD
ncbi:tetratricopeptide repeat protein [candidate division WOR-3 bacterium]|nr:tetratricopeptide repeat protein [candidate division WOR-3 bacterium]